MREEVGVGEDRILDNRRVQGTVQVRAEAVAAIQLRDSAADLPTVVRGCRVAQSPGAGPRIGLAQKAQSSTHPLGRRTLGVAVQIFLIFGLRLGHLPRALAGETEHFLRLRALGKLRLTLQLRQDLNRLSVVVLLHLLTRFFQQGLDLRGLQGWVGPRGLDRRQRRLGNRGVGIRSDGIVSHSQPGTRVVFARSAQDALCHTAQVEWAGAQPIPFLARGFDFGHEGMDLQALTGQLHGRGIERLTLRFEIHREVACRIAAIGDEDARLLRLLAKQTNAQAARACSLGEHERLGLCPRECQGDFRAE